MAAVEPPTAVLAPLQPGRCAGADAGTQACAARADNDSGRLPPAPPAAPARDPESALNLSPTTSPAAGTARKPLLRDLDERDYGEIKVGHRVIVRSPAFRGRDVAGTVSSIAPIIEAGRIAARGQRNLTDVNVAEAVIDLSEPGPLAVGMKVDVYFNRATQ